jgi:hypothetical protein
MTLANAQAVFGQCATLPLRERIGTFFAVLLFLFILGVGIDAIIHPKRHRRAQLRREGDMLREWNEIGAQFAGLAFCCFSGWMLYELVRSIWHDCFK